MFPYNRAGFGLTLTSGGTMRAGEKGGRGR